MRAVVSAGTGKPYGLALVCRSWGLARSSIYWRRQRRSSDRINLRPGPVGPCPDRELVEEIKTVLKESPFHGEGYRKAWARLRFRGVRRSKRRTLRLMREQGLLALHRVGRRHGPKAHEGTIVTGRVDEMWGTDMTSGWTSSEGQAAVFIAVDPLLGRVRRQTCRPNELIVSRPWSRSGRGSGLISGPLIRGSPEAASHSGTTTAARVHGRRLSKRARVLRLQELAGFCPRA